MNKIIQTLLILLTANQLFASASEWSAFKSEHGLKFETRLEESMRERLFNENKARIEKFNAEKSSEAGFTQGLNHFATWTREEFEKMSGYRPSLVANLEQENSLATHEFIDDLSASHDDIPAEVDWTKVADRVSPVGDQGKCYCSYAFSAAGAMEGQMVNQNKSFVQLSVQNLLDCSKDNHGCDGGYAGASWEDIVRKGGIEAEKTYPFVGEKQDCKFNKSRSVFVNKAGIAVPHGEDTLKRAVAVHGPVSAMMYGYLDSFKNYKEGIYYDKECSNFILDLRHAVLVVGYGTDAETKADYWLIKNSWGTDWGMKGYFKLARNRGNNCGIASYAGLPTF